MSVPIFPPGNGSGGVSHVSFPILGDGQSTPLGLSPGKNPLVQFCSPTGSDSADGLTLQTAKQTLLAAGQYLAVQGGGTIYFADATTGPLWMRGDTLAGTAGGGWTTGSGPLAATWLPLMPLQLIGLPGTVSSQFGGNCAQITTGNPFVKSRQDAMIWLVACSGVPILIQNTIPFGGIHNAPYRVGMDFRRNRSTGAILFANVTSWARVTTGSPSQTNPGTATLTLALPAGTSIASATRTGHAVQITYPSSAYDVARTGLFIQVTSTDGNFPSGSYSIDSITSGGGNTTLHYTDASSSTNTGTTIGTWATHGVFALDYIEVASVSAEVPSGPYICTSVIDSTHITVNDYYGYAPRTPTITVANPGQYVLQDRSSNVACGLIDLVNINGSSDTSRVNDRFGCGPTVDLGATADGRERLSYGSCGGMLSSTCFDPDRACWLLMSAGATWAAGVELAEHLRPNASGMRVYASPGFSWSFTGNDIIADIGVGNTGSTVPQLNIINANSFGSINVNEIGNADGDPSVAAIKVDGRLGFFYVTNCGILDAPLSGAGIGINNPSLLAADWASRTKSFPSYGLKGDWVSGRTTLTSPDLYRTLGNLSSGRFTNLVSADTSTWVLTGTTLTTGQADPLGGTGAVKMHTTLAGSFTEFATASPTWTVGDRYLWGFWYRCASGVQSGAAGYVGALDSIPGSANGPFRSLAENVFTGDGEWNFFSGGFTVAVVDNPAASYRYYCFVNIGSDVFIYQPTLYRIVAGTLTDNEFAELALTMRSQPSYLPPGFIGTSAGTKFVAHGGLGTAARYVVGVASGQITLGAATGKAVQLFDEAGNSLGVVAPLGFTVNP